MKQKILIVEDEPEIVKLIVNRLDSGHYDISIEYDGEKALKLIETRHFDLVSLDIMLPSVNGLVLCEALRKRHKDTLIMIVSALDSEEEKAKAYRLGADDYMPKPFSPKGLALKMATLLKRRFELQHTHLIGVRLLKYDEMQKSFYVKDQKLPLTLSEHMVLFTLFQTPRNVFSKEELSQILYNENIGDIDSKGIGTHIYQLRKKIAEISDENIIKTVRNTGYTLYEN